MAIADSHQDGDRRKVLWALLSLLMLQTALVWSFRYFPSQDGPAHLGTSAVLAELQRGNDFLSAVYQSSWRLASSQAYHALLLFTSKAMPLLAAEKLILSLYGALFSASVWFLISSVHGRHDVMFLAMPAVFSTVLYLGFFNACLALVAGIGSLALFFRLSDEDTLTRRLMLCISLLLTYSLHIFVLLLVLMAMMLFSITRSVTLAQRHLPAANTNVEAKLSTDLKAGMRWLLPALPSMLLVVHFMATTPEKSGTGSETLLERAGAILAVFEPNLIVKAYHALITFSLTDLIVQLPWYGLFLWTSFLCVRATRTHGIRRDTATAFNHAHLWVAAVVVFLLIALLPIVSGPVVNTDSRLTPFLVVAWTLWLSTGSLGSRQWRLVRWLGFTIALLQLVYRFPMHAALNEDLHEYLQVQSHIPAETSIVTIDLGPVSHEPFGPSGGHLPFNPMEHAAGYMILDKPLVNIRNYQLAYPYFPISHVQGLSFSLYAPIWHENEFLMDLNSEELQAFPALETVVFWADPDIPLHAERLASMQKSLASQGFVPDFVSHPRSLARTFVRQSASGTDSMLR